MTAGISKFGRREFVKMGGAALLPSAWAVAGINCVVRRFVKAHFRIA